MAYVNSQETIGTTAASINVDIPTGAVAGLMATVAVWAGANANADTFTGAGFEQLFPQQAIGSHGVFVIFGKLLSEDESGVWPFVWQSAAQSVAMATLNSGRDTGANPYSIIQATEASGVSQPPALEGVADDGDDLIYFVAEFLGQSGLTVPDFMVRIDDSTDGFHLWTDDDVPAGDVSVQTSVGVSTQWWPALIGIKAASTPPPPPAPSARRSITRYGDSKSWPRWR